MPDKVNLPIIPTIGSVPYGIARQKKTVKQREKKQKNNEQGSQYPKEDSSPHIDEYA